MQIFCFFLKLHLLTLAFISRSCLQQSLLWCSNGDFLFPSCLLHLLIEFFWKECPFFPIYPIYVFINYLVTQSFICINMDLCMFILFLWVITLYYFYLLCCSNYSSFSHSSYFILAPVSFWHAPTFLFCIFLFFWSYFLTI